MRLGKRTVRCIPITKICRVHFWKSWNAILPCFQSGRLVLGKQVCDTYNITIYNYNWKLVMCSFAVCCDLIVHLVTLGQLSSSCHKSWVSHCDRSVASGGRHWRQYELRTYRSGTAASMEILWRFIILPWVMHPHSGLYGTALCTLWQSNCTVC